jgi:NTE family protein
MSGTPLQADLVLSGGGVKGIGLAGAVVALMEAGYTAPRVSGTSAGAVVGAIVAAGQQGNQLSPDQVRGLAMNLPYPKFLDAEPLTRIPVLGAGWDLLTGNGLYKGDFAHQWIGDQLARLGVSTFRDLALDDDDLPPEQRYSLVVTVADVTLGQLVRLPWDYRRLYGLDPDEQPVADAVRASMSIPFFFRAAKLTSTAGLTSTLVDGGLLSNFPLDSFDRCDTVPRWPTFGVTLLPNLPRDNAKLLPALGPLNLLGGPHLLEELVTTMIVGRDQAYLDHPWVSARVIRVDSTDVSFLDFHLTTTQKEELFGQGYAAAQQFLSTWSWPQYLEHFRR